jgi:hypothetical protein
VNRRLRRIFGHKTEERIDRRKILGNEELHNMYISLMLKRILSY